MSHHLVAALLQNVLLLMSLKGAILTEVCIFYAKKWGSIYRIWLQWEPIDLLNQN